MTLICLSHDEQLELHRSEVVAIWTSAQAAFLWDQSEIPAQHLMRVPLPNTSLPATSLPATTLLATSLSAFFLLVFSFPSSLPHYFLSGICLLAFSPLSLSHELGSALPCSLLWYHNISSSLCTCHHSMCFVLLIPIIVSSFPAFPHPCSISHVLFLHFLPLSPSLPLSFPPSLSNVEPDCHLALFGWWAHSLPFLQQLHYFYKAWVSGFWHFNYERRAVLQMTPHCQVFSPIPH